MAGQELSVPQESGALKRVDLDPSYGTLIKIQKTDVFAGAGEKRATNAQIAALCGPIETKDVRVLPDTASLYLPWSWYADRLTKAFGPMGWSLLPVTDEQNNPQKPVAKDNVMYREFILRAEGRFIASAVGECSYNPNNARMTYGDAVEGAKSNALSRCCKVLGMASDIYSDGWREEWTKENAVCVVVMGHKGRQTLWRRKTALPLKNEQGHANPPCPCEACAAGVTNMAQDGKPIYNAPTQSVNDGPISGADQTTLKNLMGEFHLNPAQMIGIVSAELGRPVKGSQDVKQSELAKIVKLFDGVRMGAINLKDGMIERPPQ